MNFDQWSEDVWGMVEWWHKLLVSLLMHPERLVIGNGQIDALYAKAWPLAVTVTIAILLGAASFMIVAFGKSAEHVIAAIKTTAVVFIGVWAARELSPILLKLTGTVVGSIMQGVDTSTLPFPYMGKGFGPWLAHSIDLILVVLTVVFVIGLAPIIIITAGLIMLSYALRLFGRAGEKQWQIFISCWLNAHFIGILLIAAFVRFSYNVLDSGLAKEIAMVLAWVLFTLGIILVGGSFYLTYAASSYVTGGRLKADSHNDGGEIDRVGAGDRTEPQVHREEPQWQNYTTQGPSAPPDGEIPPSNVSSSGRTASSSGLEIGLRDTSPQVQTPTGAPRSADSSDTLKPSEQTTSDGGAPRSGYNLHYPVGIPTDKDHKPHIETDPPQWTEESPVPPPLPYPDAERTQEIPIQESGHHPAPSDITPEYPNESAPPLSGVEYIETSRRELGLEDYAPRPANSPESEVRNEPAVDTGPQFE